MAKATSILSPKRAAERMRRHQLAVRVLALMRAKKAVQAQIRAKGQRISDYSAKAINHLAEAELECNRTRLIAEAEQVIAASPLFAYLNKSAQTERQPKSTTSTLQILGAK